MLLRASRDDAEGCFRRHWLLVDSLEIWCDLRRRPYFGPKKAIRDMGREDPGGAALYEKALRGGDVPALSARVASLSD